MVGGGSRRNEGSVRLESSNVFAALDSLRKKKKSSSSKGNKSSTTQLKEPEAQVFWKPTPLKSVSWADVDDDDDYYATVPPPVNLWGTSDQKESKESSVILDEESESEEDLDDGDEENDSETQHKHEVSSHVEPAVKRRVLPIVIQKEHNRQLSKKELKKKELAELDAVLAEFGINDLEPHEEKITEQQNQHIEKDNFPGATVSKISKKKKKKERTSNYTINDSQHLTNNPEADVFNEGSDAQSAKEDNSVIDVKERLKKVATMKKKKSSKEMDAAAKAAAAEAATRNAKLTAARKKEKNHYNQQPIR